MSNKSIYTYTEEEFINLTYEERENLILRMTKLARKNTFRYQYFNKILDEFDNGVYDDLEKIKELHKKLFDKSVHLQKSPNPKEPTLTNNRNKEDDVFKRYKRFVKRQSIFIILLMLPIALSFSAAIASESYDFWPNFIGYFLLIWSLTSLLFAILLQILFLPSNIARARRHPRKWTIIFLNLCGPIGGIPWIIAMVLALEELQKNTLL